MCGRFVLSDASWAEYHDALSIIPSASAALVSYNIKPTQNIAIAGVDDGEVRAAAARWWFVPHWHKGDVSEWKATTFNAKIETAREKPTFRTAWRSGRCIIPASGYYEWTGEKGKKQPWFISVRQNAPIFFFAGLCSILPDGSMTCTILTRAAADEVSGIHPRMPVILTNEQLSRWLAQQDDDAHVIETYGASWPGGYRYHRISPFGIRDDGPSLIEPVEP